MIGPKAPKPTPVEERQARAAVKGRDGGRCVRCGGLANNFDHRRNSSQGGQIVASNGQLLCGTGTTGCHGWKTSHPAEAIATGYAVPGYADPAFWPAARSFGDVTEWCLYTDDAQIVPISQVAAARLRGELA